MSDALYMSPYHVAYVLPDTSELKYRAVTGEAGLVAFVRGLPKGTQALLVLGERLSVTAGPYRTIRLPDGSTVLKLYDEPSVGPVDDSLLLGQGDPPVHEDPEYADLVSSLDEADGDDEDEEAEDSDEETLSGDA